MGKTRSLETTWKNLLVELLRAMVGLVVAFTAAAGIAWWAGWGRWSVGGLAVTAVVFVALALLALLATSGRPIQVSLMEQRRAIAEQEAVLRAAASRHQFAADLQNALDMAEEEGEAVMVAGRAIAAVHPGPAQMLLADSSRAHLKEALPAGGQSAGCGVSTPWSCPAVRRGMTLEFGSSTELAACPRLVERGTDLSALCVPVTILGTPMGVLHTTAEAGSIRLPAQRTNLETVAMQVGARVGVLRAMAASQLAASTDPLTGRLNRRTMEDRLRELSRDGTDYAVVFADLDRFKMLNDTHGHAAGDKALVHFARVMAGVVRAEDLVCRYGGEEFVIVFPHCRVHEAIPVVERIREELVRTIPMAGVAAVTASFGVADATYAEDPSAVIACADSALLLAKRAGRDRVMVAERPPLDGTDPVEGARPTGEASHPRLSVA